MSEAPIDDPVLDVPVGRVLPFAHGDLFAVRRFARECAAAAGLAPERVDDVVMAVNEAATNAIEHGGGGGTVRVWTEHGSMVVEVRNAGGPPLHGDAGRTPPDPRQPRGRGLWLIRSLTDLFDVRPGPIGSVVRMQVRI